ncbi:sugar phosphate isomerase/epimerase family protein [Niabella ginsengisoli]|uniref:TIM barrel protein n=1 Tax=Niabella ginsengisoli TaxID=522298 RepID=A0ABS9SLM7_9BACT|nr:TIM barrel protein [Niabella ginsengisoli]MCH5599252.1 TIM barrel protein [Niabella ginsengisoli]
MKQNRREFIGISAAASAALFFSKMEAFASNIKTGEGMKGTEIKIMQTNWGFEGDMDAFCAKAKKSGYDGVELWWPGDVKAQEAMFTALDKYDLEIGFLCGGGQKDPEVHLTAFKKMIDAAAKQKRKKPLYINNHSGKDYFSFDENAKFIEHTTALSKETGITICHETHRSRMLYSAPVAKEYIKKFPELKLTLDISHWCCVHESLLVDQAETVNMALERTEHIHARIGHPEGPQVNDPRAPEWENVVKAHFAWWDKIVERKTNKGETITFLTEFGPPDYMPTMPYSRKPLAELWEVNVYMMQLLRKRYEG